MVSLLLASLAGAAEAPAGTEIHLRLQTKISTAASKTGDPVEAIVIVPVVSGDAYVIPAGAQVRGAVQEVKAAARQDERALLAIKFTDLQLGGRKVPIDARLKEVDNARESVDEKGVIVGILASETLSARIDQGIGKVAQKYGGLADVLDAAKGAVMGTAESGIDYEPGVEMTIRLERPVALAAGARARDLALFPFETELADLVARQPFQTTAQKPPKPSDMTNLMFVGTQAHLEKGFTAAGWTTAAALTGRSRLETFRAIAELRGYKEAPVSILLLDGRPPDLVFQKQNNTFAQRHHLRIWRRPEIFLGREVWVCAATHDIGIDFSQENLTFIHRIDPQIDRERAKVVNDLLLTGMVKALALVERPAVPKNCENATGDRLETDGRLAVLLFQ